MGNTTTKPTNTPPITIATLKTHALNALNFVSNLTDHIQLPRTSIEQKEIQNLWSIYYKQLLSTINKPNNNSLSINTKLYENLQILPNSIHNIQQETWIESKLEYMHGTDLNHNRNQPFVRNRRGSNISNTSNTTPTTDLTKKDIKQNMEYMINIKTDDDLIADTTALNTTNSSMIDDNYNTSHDGLFEFALDDSNINIENTSFDTGNKCKEVISEFKFDFSTKYENKQKPISMLFTVCTQFVNGNCMYFYNQRNWRTTVVMNNLHFIFCEYLFAIHDIYGMFDDMSVVVKRKSILKSSVIVNNEREREVRFCIGVIVDYLYVGSVGNEFGDDLMVVYDNDMFVEGNDENLSGISDMSMFEWNLKSLKVVSQLLVMVNESESEREVSDDIDECEYSVKEFIESVLCWFLNKDMIQFRRENVDKQITWIEDI